jgi:hypothetical protein
MTPFQPQQYPILDGFQFSTKLRCNLTFRNLVLEQYEALRRSTAMRNKTWCVPQDSTILIPAYGSYERQVYVPAGSVIWGYSFSGVTAGADPGQSTPAFTGTQSWEIRDNCDDIPLFSEIVTRRFAEQSPTPPANLGGAGNQVPQQYLTKLLVVGIPGLLNVILANTYATPQVGQLVLFGGEPFVG